MKKLIIILNIIFLLYAGVVAADEYDESFWRLTKTQLFALTIYGEARGETIEGKIAVGTTVLERTRQCKIGNIKRIILQPYQFSCFLPSDKQYWMLKGIANEWSYNYRRLKLLQESYEIAKGLLSGTIEGHRLLIENKVTHYKTIDAKPTWANKMQLVLTIGTHQFYAPLEKDVIIGESLNDYYNKYNNTLAEIFRMQYLVV